MRLLPKRWRWRPRLRPRLLPQFLVVLFLAGLGFCGVLAGVDTGAAVLTAQQAAVEANDDFLYFFQPAVLTAHAALGNTTVWGAVATASAHSIAQRRRKDEEDKGRFCNAAPR